MFYLNQPEEQRSKYIKYLQLVGSISRIYSQSPIPYLYYRAAENIFCLAFDAEDLSRSDVSADAKKNSIGIGLKTFLHSNGKTLQKVAEFNAMSPTIYKSVTIEEKIQTIAELRNERIRVTKELNGLHDMCYHCVTRDIGVNKIYEFPMDLIDIDNLHIDTASEKSVIFYDGINEYSFNFSKSTLLKRFVCDDLIDVIEVDIYENPLDFLMKKTKDFPHKNELIISKETLKSKSSNIIYLPLYAPSSKQLEPAEKSGLNQWNASGRARHPDEVYIPIPAWIHKKFPDFFPPSNDYSFDLILQNGEKLSASTCQAGRKGLMSNPNKDLGKWLLRDVLNIPEGVLISRKHLEKAGIDSVKLTKIEDNVYKIDFMPIGNYEYFKDKCGE